VLRLLVSLCAILVIDANATSFDCTKATTNVERLICSDKTLAALDDELDSEYQNAKRLYGEVTTPLNTQQKAWLADRNQCKSKVCLEQSYKVRIRELACEPKNSGSATGYGKCAYLQLLESETILAPLEQHYASQVIAASSNQEHVKELLITESKKWREYRDANCALLGATTGGSDAWRNAWATGCALAETKKRLADLMLPDSD